MRSIYPLSINIPFLVKQTVSFIYSTGWGVYHTTYFDWSCCCFWSPLFFCFNTRGLFLAHTKFIVVVVRLCKGLVGWLVYCSLFVGTSIVWCYCHPSITSTWGVGYYYSLLLLLICFLFVMFHPVSMLPLPLSLSLLQITRIIWAGTRGMFFFSCSFSFFPLYALLSVSLGCNKVKLFRYLRLSMRWEASWVVDYRSYLHIHTLGILTQAGLFTLLLVVWDTYVVITKNDTYK